MSGGSVIVKVQKPLAGDDTGACFLVYAEGRRNQRFLFAEELPLPVAQALDKFPKQYVTATWSLTRDTWDLGQIVGPQPW